MITKTLYIHIAGSSIAGLLTLLGPPSSRLEAAPSARFPVDTPRRWPVCQVESVLASTKRTTRSGLSYSLPASTGTKSTRGVLSFVSPEGETINYFGIRFVEVD